MNHFALFTLGVALLAAGAAVLVFAAARLDLATGRSPFAVGVVAVAFGPCVAGLALDLALVTRPQSKSLSPVRVAVGVICGSNIASIGLVLGAATLVRPLSARAKLFRTAIPLAFVATLLFFFLASSDLQVTLSHVEAGVLLGVCAVVLVVLIRAARRECEAVKAEFASWLPEAMPVRVAVLLALTGLAALVGGAILAASEASATAAYLRMTSLAFGTTAGAFGASLPALVAAVVAARRGRPDLVLGVVVGPILFNLLLTAGVVALAQPLVIERRAVAETVPAMALFTLLLLPVLLKDLHAPRWEGAVLIAAFAGFVVWQIVAK